MQYILAVLMTFLPPRYRAEGAKLRNEAMTAGWVQASAAILFLLYRFYIFSWERAGLIGPGVNTVTNLPDINARSDAGAGIFMMADFIFQPFHAFLLYLFYEGLLRFMAAYIGHQVIGTLPLYAVSGIHGLIDKANYNRYIGPLIQDEAVRGSGKLGYDLKVYSCRAKRDWNTYVTIEFEEQWYQLIRDERGSKPRPYIYYLRKAAATRPAVVIRKYKPDDVLKANGNAG